MIFGYILVVLLLFFVTLYVLTGLFITKELNWFGINDKGEVVGVNTLKLTSNGNGEYVDSFNFAIPINHFLFQSHLHY